MQISNILELECQEYFLKISAKKKISEITRPTFFPELCIKAKMMTRGICVVDYVHIGQGFCEGAKNFLPIISIKTLENRLIHARNREFHPKTKSVEANGRVVRVPLERDRRIFTPTPRSSVSWRRAYNRRSALERINSRIDNSFGFEKHFIRGKAKMTARVGLALAVMMALAVGHIKAGRPECMRSLVSGCYADTG